VPSVDNDSRFRAAAAACHGRAIAARTPAGLQGVADSVISGLKWKSKTSSGTAGKNGRRVCESWATPNI